MNDFIKKLYQNHVLANLTFILILVIGALSYAELPRQQDPTINFNWIVITTVLPGASALDVEKKVTDPLEDALATLRNVDFTSSNSRESVSSILLRFQDISQRVFDKRISDLRREIQNAESELPEEAETPKILEITSANAFPAATIAVYSKNLDENLRVQAKNIQKDLERINGVDRIDSIGLPNPELQIIFNPEVLENFRLSPNQIAITVSNFFQDIAAGDIKTGGQKWLVRLVGSDSNMDSLAKKPILNADEKIMLGQVSEIKRGIADASQLTSFQGNPAILLAVMKQANSNTLNLVKNVQDYLNERNELEKSTGIKLALVDDQTIMTRKAISLMQNNALIGLVLVLFVTWAFLGTRIAMLTAIGIPFILAGTFWILSLTGETLNVMVLLGIVIALGMLVDDAVVVAEGIYYRLQKGADALTASFSALKEVSAPVTAAVFTTIAAFGPLIIMPGILGDFMKVVPIVVVTGLALSLLESFWMLPAHVIALKVKFDNPSKLQKLREKYTHLVRIFYVRLLIKALREKTRTVAIVSLLFFGALGAIGAGLVKVDFFAADNIRVFYVNIEMAPETSLQDTLKKVEQIEKKVRKNTSKEEIRAIISYAGNMFIETAPRLGDHMGQIMIGLNPKTDGLRSVQEMIEDMREDVTNTPGPIKISFLRLSGGPPIAKAISIKVRGDNYEEIESAASAVKNILKDTKYIIDINDDASIGRNELILKLDSDAIKRANLNPLEINQTLQLLVGGLTVADYRDNGEKVEVRVRGLDRNLQNVSQLLKIKIPLSDGGTIALKDLVYETRSPGLGNIRHYNFRRAITIEADILLNTVNTKTANEKIIYEWDKYKNKYPNIDLDFSGQLDDIDESIKSMGILFIAGLGIMFAILGTQFKSYFQPFMILSTVLMAFTGVTYGLLVSNNPLSLYTLYGVVALAGIAVNSAIVLISAGNQRLKSGMSVLHATIYAARRRVIPILITSLTTIAGLFSLATGLGGDSLIWGPVATAIVWGLAFSTILTLIVIPLLYCTFMKKSKLIK